MNAIPKPARLKCTRYLVAAAPPPGARPDQLPPLAPSRSPQADDDALARWLAHVQAGRIPVR